MAVHRRVGSISELFWAIVVERENQSGQDADAKREPFQYLPGHPLPERVIPCWIARFPNQWLLGMLWGKAGVSDKYPITTGYS